MRNACLAFALCFAATAALAEPIGMAPLETLQTVRGRVEARSSGQTIVLTVAGQDQTGDRFFKVETDREIRPPVSFRTDSAQILFWAGHLVVVAPREGKAWHFSIPEIDVLPRPDHTMPRAVPDAAELDAFLGQTYQLTRIDSVTAIVSREGPQAFRDPAGGDLKKLFANEDDQQDPGSGGVGSCGKVCTITCGDGSGCSASCGPNRCASCTCPAACICSSS